MEHRLPHDDRTETGVVPQCRHGAILLACVDDDCPEQITYLASQEAALAVYETQLRENARRALGLPPRSPASE